MDEWGGGVAIYVPSFEPGIITERQHEVAFRSSSGSTLSRLLGAGRSSCEQTVTDFVLLCGYLASHHVTESEEHAVNFFGRTLL